MKSKFRDPQSVGISGRGAANHIELGSDDSISIGNDQVEVSLLGDKSEIDIDANVIRLRTGIDSEYSSVNGEELADILRWIIQVLKKHQHGPNSPAVPDFHVDANAILDRLDDVLLNKNVRHN